MASFKSFEEIDVWKLARELAAEIHKLTSLGSFSKDYALKDQINRSSGAIMDNIAEGFERGGNREFIQFLSIAKGSSAEVRSQLFRAFDRKYITEDVFISLREKSNLISKKLNSLINYLINSDLKGMKFHETEELYSKQPSETLQPKSKNSEHTTQNPERKTQNEIIRPINNIKIF